MKVVSRFGLIVLSGTLSWLCVSTMFAKEFLMAQTVHQANHGSQVKRGWGPEQATGPPDTPRAGDITTAWASLRPDAGLEWLKVDFRNAVQIAEVRIRETFNPGAVSKVVALLDNGREQTLWKGQDPTKFAPADFVIKPDARVTSKHIIIYVQTTRKSGWNEIDAVELVGTDGTRQWALSASASSTFAEHGNRHVNQSGHAANTRYFSMYEGLVGKSAKIYFEGGQSLEGIFLGSDSQYVVLRWPQKNKKVLINKDKVLYIELVQ